MARLVDMSPKAAMEHYMKGNMAGRYLGECLEDSRWGSITTVMYETDIKGMVDFVDSWMKQNPDNFQELFYKKGHEKHFKDMELPYLNHKKCPRRSDHSGTVVDMLGLVRCGHSKVEMLKPSYLCRSSFFDRLSQSKKVEYYHVAIQDPVPCDGYDKFGNVKKFWREEARMHKREIKKFEDEEESFRFIDRCAAILSDRGGILSLETVIRRKELSEGYHPSYRFGKPVSEFTFDGVTMAAYVKKWWEQKERPLYDPPIPE